MELKANELRIGNLIYAPSGVEKYVFGTRYKTILYTAHLENPTYGESYDYECEPIPLTEEWLLKFGFEKKESIWFLNEIQITSWFTFRFSLEPLKVQEIDYVHQLQNLYFVLTNKELEIKM